MADRGLVSSQTRSSFSSEFPCLTDRRQQIAIQVQMERRETRSLGWGDRVWVLGSRSNFRGSNGDGVSQTQSQLQKIRVIEFRLRDFISEVEVEN